MEAKYKTLDDLPKNKWGKPHLPPELLAEMAVNRAFDRHIKSLVFTPEAITAAQQMYATAVVKQMLQEAQREQQAS